nr:hypothetical protein [Candidatus Competibacter phosphatis]
MWIKPNRPKAVQRGIDSTHGHIENMIQFIDGRLHFREILQSIFETVDRCHAKHVILGKNTDLGRFDACFSHVGDQCGDFIASVWTIVQCVFVTDIAQRIEAYAGYLVYSENRQQLKGWKRPNIAQHQKNSLVYYLIGDLNRGDGIT